MKTIYLTLTVLLSVSAGTETRPGMERVNNSGASLAIFPDPVGPMLNNRSHFRRQVDCNIELFDVKGALEKKWSMKISAGLQTSQFAMSLLARQQLFIPVKDKLNNVLFISKLNKL